MSIKTDAQTIRDETSAGANTAKRVGTNLVAIADDLLAKQTAIDANTANIANVLTNVETVQFDTAYTETGSEPEGSLYWDNTDKTLSLVQNNTKLQLGQELHVRVRNTTGSTITNGSVVYISSRTGTFPNVSLARSDVDTTARTLGIVTEDIANNSFGFVTTFGYVRGLKTNYTGTGVWGTTWAEGDMLYLSSTTAGQLTNVPPDAPNHADVVGTVGVLSASNGTVLTIINRHKALSDLSDVNGTPVTTSGQILVWDNANQYFDFTENINDYLKSANVDTLAKLNALLTDATLVDANSIFTVDSGSSVVPVFWSGTQTEYDTQFPSGAPSNYFAIITDGTTAPLDASDIVVDATGFAGNLSGTDTNVQIALTTIDGLAISGSTNLGTTQSATNVIVTSDTGTDATIPLGNGTNAGVSLNDYTTADATKVGFISITQAVDLDTLESDVATNNAKVGVTTEISSLVEDTTPQLGGELDLNGHSVGGAAQTATGDGATTIDWGNGNFFHFQFGAFNETFTFTDPANPGTFILKLVQDSVGSRTATWPASVKWTGGTAPTLTTTATTGTDIITFYFDGTNYFGVDALNFS